MKKYRKKPVVIEALVFEYSKEGIEKLKEFLGDKLGICGKERRMDAIAYAQILTLEDGDKEPFKVSHIASEGDYIIKGVKGEFYACKPSIFKETYEEELS